MRVSPLGCTDCPLTPRQVLSDLSNTEVEERPPFVMGVRAFGRYDEHSAIRFWQTLTIVMMDLFLNITATASIVISAGIIAAATKRLRTTTLFSAGMWSLAAVLFWLITVIRTWADQGEGADAAGELMWFATALLCLCPPMAALGARKPGARAWTWFVLVPLLAVLGWPALTVWGSGLQPHPLQLETPQLAGFLLVLLMGTGNYVGTKFRASAFLYAVAICLIVAPLSAASPGWLSPTTMRAVAGMAIGLSTVLARIQAARSSLAHSPIDRLWSDYRDLFGIVWAHRLQDRLNTVARQQNWPVEVTPRGFVWEDAVSSELRRETTDKIEQSLRWMLRRFVEPEWIDQRLNGS